MSKLSLTSRKSCAPSSLGTIDRLPQTRQASRVKQKNVILKVVQVLSCLAFGIALLLSPLSGAHAHDTATGVLAESTSDMHHGASSGCAAAEHGTKAAQSVDDKMGSFACCGGVCLSDALADEQPDATMQITRGHYAVSAALFPASDTVGFLRPPNT